MGFTFVKGFYVPDAGTKCPACDTESCLDCFPGEWPQCSLCKARIIRYGRVPKADCVTSTGRVDMHMSYLVNVDGKLQCFHCKKNAPKNHPKEKCTYCGVLKSKGTKCKPCCDEHAEDPDAFK